MMASAITFAAWMVGFPGGGGAEHGIQQGAGAAGEQGDKPDLRVASTTVVPPVNSHPANS
jgi:hypothetical protein